MNAEIKDCIESLLGEFKRVSPHHLKQWINESEGNRLLVKAICLIEQDKMNNILSLIDLPKEAEEQAQPQEEQGAPTVLTLVFSIIGAEVTEQRGGLDNGISSKLHQVDNDAIEDCIHDLEHEHTVGIKDIYLGWFVSKWNERAEQIRDYNKLIFSIVDNFVYLKFE